MPFSWNGSGHSGVSSVFMRLWPQPTSTFLTPIYFLFLKPSTILTLLLSLPRSHDHACFSNIYFTWVGLPAYKDCGIFNRGLLHVHFIYLFSLCHSTIVILLTLTAAYACKERENTEGWWLNEQKQIIETQATCKCWSENVIYHTALQLQWILQQTSHQRPLYGFKTEANNRLLIVH